MRPVDQRTVARQVVGREPHVLKIEADVGPIEDPHDDAFAMDGGQSGNTKIQLMPLHPVLDTTILWKPALGYVKVSKQLDARGNGRGEGGIDQFAFLKNTVDAIANVEPVFEGFDVNVGRSQVDDTRDDLIDQPDDRRLGGKVLQMLDKLTVTVRCAESPFFLGQVLLGLGVEPLQG